MLVILDPEDEHLRVIVTRHSKGYWLICQNGRQELLHRFLMEAPEGMTVDHKNGNRDDCRKDNLRLATYSQNNCNIGKKLFILGTTSKYKGVYKYKGKQKPWWAYIKTGGKRKSLGYFSTEEEAARAYNKAALELHGEFANVNVF